MSVPSNRLTPIIVAAFPDIHYNIKNGIARWNWLMHEYRAPVKWDDVAESIFEDIPFMEIAIEAALKAGGY
jgi:hypothetical protein